MLMGVGVKKTFDLYYIYEQSVNNVRVYKVYTLNG